jgi:poly-gamma-glutamate capsule biosynthesis protein CapA/YwtB (metallophosphatase superfamily)
MGKMRILALAVLALAYSSQLTANGMEFRSRAVSREPPAASGELAHLHALQVDTIENFDDGTVELRSYPGEDVQPDSWRLDSINTYQGSRYSLRLFGNTWKLEPIARIQLDSGDVWQVAAYVESLGEIQGFGLVDSAHTLFYSLAGTELLNTDTWATVYQGAFPQQSWNTYRLPVAQDWLAGFGYLPAVSGIVFLNDRDADPHAIVYFDEVIDITHDLPVPPQVEIWHTMGEILRNADGRMSVTVQFHSRVTDPDSRAHQYFWHFGDDSTSGDSNPVHTYVVGDDHQYTVLLEVVDSTGLWGRAADQVTVDPGPTTFPVTVNFTGDIMLARGYDTPGGLIDTLGVDAIFDPTLPYLGNAADITVANLESPLTANGTRHPTKPIAFRGRPKNVAGLAYAGIDLVSLANNHVIDYGLEGLRETQESLAANGILYSGAGANSDEAYRPVFRQKSGIVIAFLASCNRTGQYDNYQPYLDAGFNKPGFALLDTSHLARQIQTVESVADVVVVEMHSGEEYSPVPPDVGEEEFYFPRALVPDLHDIALRHQAINQGADLVVNHHPHILQGFEVYNGKLIAHSLGNFTFDLSYPETYPSVILKGKIDARGFYDYSVTPAYIDDWIPMRARGELGLHILDDLSRRSKDLGTYLAVDRDSVTARIVLDTLTMTRAASPYTDELDLRPAVGYWTSDPVRLRRNGSISAVSSITPSRDWQYRLGRELVWFGNFEDEGSTLWLLNQTGEGYDTLAHRGHRSLLQLRPAGSGSITTNLEERPVLYSDSTDYTLHGFLMTQNARNADVAVKLYTARTGSSPIDSSDLGIKVTGTSDWTFYQHEFRPAAGSAYYDVWLRSQAPQSGAGDAWFDDVGVIEWAEWEPFTGPVRIPAPNDYYWIQARTSDSTPDAQLSYEETVFSPNVTAMRADRAGRELDFRSFLSYPNPCRSGSAIRYNLTRAAKVTLKVYDVLGREVKLLVDEAQTPGMKTVVWDGRDDQGREVSSGIYFIKLVTENGSFASKAILLK